MHVPLSRAALRRVLHSLIIQTPAPSVRTPAGPATPRIDEALLFAEQPNLLGFDSLDMVQIAAAVNEMFHLHEVGLEVGLTEVHLFADWLDVIEEAWRRGIKHLTVTTSGSSGRPKPCTHSFEALSIEVGLLAKIFSDRRRVVAFTPAHHMYGLLFSAMLPDRLGVVATSLLQEPLGATTQFSAGDLVVSFPEGWSWILKSRGAFPADVVGVTSTAPCPAPLTEALMEAGLGRLVEIYGSSESAGVGVRVWPASHFNLMDHWTRAGQDAEPEQLQHHLGFTTGVMDHLQFLDSRTFLVQGRKDQAVQVGGVNIFPSLIAQRLQGHAGVSAAAVRLMRPDEGQRLKCFVVPANGCSVADLQPLLQRWIATWPVSAERPKAISFGTSLPENRMGKPQDW